MFAFTPEESSVYWLNNQDEVMDEALSRHDKGNHAVFSKEVVEECKKESRDKTMEEWKRYKDKLDQWVQALHSESKESECMKKKTRVKKKKGKKKQRDMFAESTGNPMMNCLDTYMRGPDDSQRMLFLFMAVIFGFIIGRL